ncbi:hypothetical protein FH972_021642 [Carpinus fangiana]|uniref:Protein kinase domain-containing protein n=1 Tax=Carpinus fangiana TaxID=176857 RepID=A0A5N6KQ97_9ROSI|nr:hypothetical protein FH972_021642 [Carpinus fangiana]
MHRIALGLDYLWRCGVAHGDVYARNVLFTSPWVARRSEAEAMSRLGTPQSGIVKRSDGMGCEHNIPPYLVRSASFRGHDTEVKLADLGNAFFHDDPPPQISTPWHVRAPESIFGLDLTKYVDMWGAGCMFFEVITGRTLVDSFLADRASVINGLGAVLGPPPGALFGDLDLDDKTAFMPFDQYFCLNYDHNDAQLLGEEDEGILVEEYEKPAREFSDEELRVLCGLLKRLLNYEPTSRGTTQELLETLCRLRD